METKPEWYKDQVVAHVLDYIETGEDDLRLKAINFLIDFCKTKSINVKDAKKRILVPPLYKYLVKFISNVDGYQKTAIDLHQALQDKLTLKFTKNLTQLCNDARTTRDQYFKVLEAIRAKIKKMTYCEVAVEDLGDLGVGIGFIGQPLETFKPLSDLMPIYLKNGTITKKNIESCLNG